LHANFLRTPERVVIVDYEYAGMGDRFFDLGNFAVNNGISDAAVERLLVEYLGRATLASASNSAWFTGSPRGRCRS
jgi:thiamine kinase-like enzyme